MLTDDLLFPKNRRRNRDGHFGGILSRANCSRDTCDRDRLALAQITRRTAEWQTHASAAPRPAQRRGSGRIVAPMAPRSIPCDHRAGVEDATATDRARTSIRAFLFSRALSVFLFSCPTQIESTYSDRPQLSCVRGFAHSARRADQTSRSGLHGTRDFAAGLTYVALSRLRCWGGLMLTQAVSAARMLLLKRMQTPGGCHAPLRRESWRADSCQAKACMQEQQSARGQYRLEQRAWRADSCQAKACREHERSIQLRAGATGGDGRSGHPRHCFRPVSSDGMPMSDGGTATRSDLLRPSCDIYGHCKTVSSRIALPRCPPQHAPQPVGLPLASPDAAEYLVYFIARTKRCTRDPASTQSSSLAL
jgi:hypothetical protein